MKSSSRIVATSLCFAAGSVAMTLSTAIVIWYGHGGRSPLTIADAYIYFAEWPMVLLYGTDFYVVSGQALLLNIVGWSFMGALLGALSPRR